MLRNLYSELLKLDLKYHKVGMMEGGKISILAIDLTPDGIEEVMRIKRIAEAYEFCAIWDGENIEIYHCID